MVSGSYFKIRVQNPGFGVKSSELRLRVKGLEFRVQGLGLRVQGLGFRV